MTRMWLLSQSPWTLSLRSPNSCQKHMPHIHPIFSSSILLTFPWAVTFCKVGWSGESEAPAACAVEPAAGCSQENSGSEFQLLRWLPTRSSTRESEMERCSRKRTRGRVLTVWLSSGMVSALKPALAFLWHCTKTRPWALTALGRDTKRHGFQG